MNTDEIKNFIKGYAWPIVVSSDVAINQGAGSVVIQNKAIPMKYIFVIMGLTVAIITCVVLWKAKGQAYLILPFVVLGGVGCSFVLGYIQKLQGSCGPISVVTANEIKNYKNDVVKKDEIISIKDIYFYGKMQSGKDYYRVLLVEGENGSIPILWQITSLNRWTRPSVDELRKLLSKNIETIQFDDCIDLRNIKYV